MTIPRDAMLTRLEAAGFRFDRETTRIEARDGRTAVWLDAAHMAWFPDGDDGRAGMAREARVLRLIEFYCSFRAPRIVHEDPADGWQVRAIVPGRVAAFDLYDRLAEDAAFAHQTGAALGRMLADQHTNIPAAELAGWLPDAPDWPRAVDLPNLPRVVEDRILLARIERALQRHAEFRRDLIDPVLTHCDLGPHNFAVDPESGEVTGIFDYEGAAFGARCQDFKYMMVHQPDAQRESMLGGAAEAYEALTGIVLDRDRVRFLNATAAIAFLAYRFGHALDEDWCGRTLAEDLAWTDSALTAAGF